MEAQLIRYRATRRWVFGILNIEEFECFVMERRATRLDAGSYIVTQADSNNVVRVGDHVVSHDGLTSTKGAISVGSTILLDKLQEIEPTGERLVRIIAMAEVAGDPVNLEIIDEADYDEADRDVA